MSVDRSPARGGTVGPRLFAALAVALAACVMLSVPVGVLAGDRESPITRAINFLFNQQVRRPLPVVDGGRIVDFPGDWPQYFQLQGSEFRVRDVSPFTVAFIHHSLTHIVEDNRRVLGLRPIDIDVARVMRQRAVGFIRAFESAPGAPDAGTFAFWPYDTDPDTPDRWLEILLTAWLRGPILGGQRVPINLPIYPHTLAIPSDADVTATSYAALLDDARLDGGPGSEVAFERFFEDWRDLGVVPRRVNPPWMPPASGAFLTWLTYRNPPTPLFPNDVDLVVNGNVLYALAHYRRLATPGVADAVELIDRVTALGIHRDRLEEISNYYPDNLAFQYVVSRAYYEGLRALEPAVNILADDLEHAALVRADGAAYWDKGDPQLNTAFAVLALLNAGRDAPIIDNAIDYLISEQNALGGYQEATFFVGRTDGGQVFQFTSAAFTTAIVLEAFARYELAYCTRAGDGPPSARQHACRDLRISQ